MAIRPKRQTDRHAGIALRAIVALLSVLVLASAARAETRSLKLYYLHTKEKAEITYKINGKYSPAGLQKINRFLRDWRRNEPTKMDPRLLDLVWEVYRKSGSHDYIHVISAYRSPATNSMLRKRSKGVAKNSQHMLGKAMDFFLPDVKLSTLREIGLKIGVGGVGYYPTSGSPFVHMDTGNVRHWPRMTRQQLVRLFPDGKTLHLPADGKPLPGYDRAMAEYKARRSGSGNIQLADDDEAEESKPNFFARLAERIRENQRKAVADRDSGESGTAKPDTRTGEEPATVVASAGPAGVAAESTAKSTAVSTAVSTAESIAESPENLLAGTGARGEFDLPDIVPVPSWRPDQATLLASADDGAATGAGQRLAALTPGEIEEMRRSAVAQPPRPRAAIPQVSGRATARETYAPRPATVGSPVLAETGAQLAFLPDSPPQPALRPIGDLRGSGGVGTVPTPLNALRNSEASAVAGIPAPAFRTPTAAGQYPATATGPSASTLELALAPTDPDNRAREAIRNLIDVNARMVAPETRPTIVGSTTPSPPEREPAAPAPRGPAAAAVPAIPSHDRRGDEPLALHTVVAARGLDSVGRLTAPRYAHHRLMASPDAESVTGSFSKRQPTYRSGEFAPARPFNLSQLF